MNKHILIIDDEPGIREVLGQALQVKGYRATTAGSGAEALKLVGLGSFDLIISDLQMEDTDGFDLISQLKEKVPNVPVILLTGMIFDSEVVQKKIQPLVSAYIDKTASLQRVTDEVERLLSRSAART